MSDHLLRNTYLLACDTSKGLEMERSEGWTKIAFVKLPCVTLKAGRNLVRRHQTRLTVFFLQSIVGRISKAAFANMRKGKILLSAPCARGCVCFFRTSSDSKKLTTQARLNLTLHNILQSACPLGSRLLLGVQLTKVNFGFYCAPCT